MSSDKFNFILYADDTTLNATVESYGETAVDIQLSISNKLQKICMAGSKQVASKRCKIEVHAFRHASKSNSTVTFFLNGSPIDYVTEFIFFRINVRLQSKF